MLVDGENRRRDGEFLRGEGVGGGVCAVSGVCGVRKNGGWERFVLSQVSKARPGAPGLGGGDGEGKPFGMS